MQRLSLKELYALFKNCRGISTDTRKINEGDIFFSLKGPHFNANLFAHQALKDGAAYAVVDDPGLQPDNRLILVEDVLSTLQNLAGYHRNQLQIPVIGITGSNGKTTTKELVHAVLSMSFRTSTTQGNLNNHIGIPLTLLRIPENAELAVIEMGANHQKEIEGYCMYTNPTHGLITNCGKAHLEGFGGVEGVRKGKGELFDHLKKVGGQVFSCLDFDYFREMIGERDIMEVNWYGTSENALVQGVVLKAEPFLEVKILKGFSEPFTVTSQLVGDYNIYNILSAITIGRHFGVSVPDMKRSIAAYQPENSRSQLLHLDGNTIILDAYNANPTSMEAAIKNFAALKGNRKILMIGAMAELGPESILEHEGIVKLIKQFEWEKVILVGGDFEKIEHPFLYLENSKSAAAWWAENKVKGATILLKGSRSSAMEKVLNLEL